MGDEVDAFARLWEDRSPSTKVFDFPDAALQKLLDFLPKDDQFVTPPGIKPKLKDQEEDKPEPHKLLPEEIRQVVWPYIRHAARMWNGIRVGEVTSAITPWPHQVRSYVRMLENWPCRLLVADEVGLGKAISAGIVIRQAWLSGKARRILIMVPAGVMPQWQNELYEKFNLDVPIYDGHKLSWRKTHGREKPIERKVGCGEWSREPIVLCSSHLMRRRDRIRELLEAEPWDLVVLDEAHHARRCGAGTAQESGPNNLLRLMREFCSRCRALVLMTATPMQV
ncbi:MAG: DEAD/DEAH box helicase, partial [Pirellulaceae bacterium]